MQTTGIELMTASDGKSMWKKGWKWFFKLPQPEDPWVVKQFKIQAAIWITAIIGRILLYYDIPFGIILILPLIPLFIIWIPYVFIVANRIKDHILRIDYLIISLILFSSSASLLWFMEEGRGSGGGGDPGPIGCLCFLIPILTWCLLIFTSILGFRREHKKPKFAAFSYGRDRDMADPKDSNGTIQAVGVPIIPGEQWQCPVCRKMVQPNEDLCPGCHFRRKPKR